MWFWYVHFFAPLNWRIRHKLVPLPLVPRLICTIKRLDLSSSNARDTLRLDSPVICMIWLYPASDTPSVLNESSIKYTRKDECRIFCASFLKKCRNDCHAVNRTGVPGAGAGIGPAALPVISGVYPIRCHHAGKSIELICRTLWTVIPAHHADSSSNATQHLRLMTSHHLHALGH